MTACKIASHLKQTFCRRKERCTQNTSAEFVSQWSQKKETAISCAASIASELPAALVPSSEGVTNSTATPPFAPATAASLNQIPALRPASSSSAVPSLKLRTPTCACSNPNAAADVSELQKGLEC